ncbi:DUF4167 domain-containing protein [Sphingomonas sp. Leaf339]|uniref:DUF4167 domain-containing protein n=1 Tax=Sphingomonas sp. Leaf339 TaxID=1736343 RepID=UPI0006F497E9|nr:DUF4167 domain-containing protein [Sphingomonas sp. Leaf339]
MINNRQQQAGRRRGRGGNGTGGSGNTGGPRQGGQGRPDNGNRIDNRARGNANQLYEKYKNLAADAQRQGDRVNTEYYHQFADHYFRVLSDQRGRFEDQQPQPRRQQSDFEMDGDDDYGDEGEPIRAGEQGEAARQERNRDDRPRNERVREDRPREDRQQGDDRQRDARPRNEGRQDGNRNDAPRYEGQRNDAPRNDGQRNDSQRNDGQRNDAARNEGQRNDGQRYDAPRNDGERPRRWEREDRAPRQIEQAPEPRVEVEVAGQHRADPVASGENLQERAEAVLEADAPPPRRRGRPRRDAQLIQPDVQATSEVESVPMVESNGVDADRLPPSLGISAASEAAGSGEAPKPRRRRIRTVTPDEVGAG